MYGHRYLQVVKYFFEPLGILQHLRYICISEKGGIIDAGKWSFDGISYGTLLHAML